jgi:hypothetical protein
MCWAMTVFFSREVVTVKSHIVCRSNYGHFVEDIKAGMQSLGMSEFEHVLERGKYNDTWSSPRGYHSYHRSSLVGRNPATLYLGYFKEG